MKKDIRIILETIYHGITDDHEREYFSIHEVRYRFILEKIQVLFGGQQAKILDIGVYPPHLYNALHKLGHEVWGIASQHEKLTDKHIKTLNIEKEKFPFEAQSFDLVLMTEIIEHLTVNPRVYLSEVKRVLKPDGYLLVTTPNAVHLKNRVKVLFGKSASFPLEQLFETEPHNDSIYYRHNREFTRDELKSAFEVSGLRAVEARYFSAYTPWRKNRKTSLTKFVGYFITQLFPSLRDSLYLSAQK
jgi:2-polyprenyl-3-methyl-5-hydroxy-6-metoxy-1,4-benzoquinol methylase